MKIFSYGKDGGSESTVTGWWLVEIKRLFSIALLTFAPGSRDVYHNHAFNLMSWLLRGHLEENFVDGKGHSHIPSFKPIITKRNTFHKVVSIGTSWVLTFRGPWAKYWLEYLPQEQKFKALTHGRVDLSKELGIS